MEDEVTVNLSLPKNVARFLRAGAKEMNKTLEEYIDLIIQIDIAGDIICLRADAPSLSQYSAREVAIELGLDGYITEGMRHRSADFEPIVIRTRRAPF